MAHRKFTFPMPDEASVVFDAFHYHCWRARWDSLVSQTHVEGGARWAMESMMDWLFARQTQRRFARLQHFLAQHADDIARWQRERA